MNSAMHISDHSVLLCCACRNLPSRRSNSNYCRIGQSVFGWKMRRVSHPLRTLSALSLDSVSVCNHLVSQHQRKLVHCECQSGNQVCAVLTRACQQLQLHSVTLQVCALPPSPPFPVAGPIFVELPLPNAALI